MPVQIFGMTAHTAGIILSDALQALGLGGIVWLAFRSFRNSADRAGLLRKWLLSLGVIGVLVGVICPVVSRSGGPIALLGVLLGAFCGYILFVTWRNSIADIVASPFQGMYTGGSVEPERKPFYSIARALQKRGRYAEAIDEVEKQLARFPTDMEGQMLLAEIQAEALKDLPGAEQTIERFCAQPGHAPANIASALYSMADWHLKLGQDPQAARRNLEQVIALLPDSAFSLTAAQRIAHLRSPETFQAPVGRKQYVVTQGEQHIGLLKDRSHLLPAEAEPGKQAAEYVKHLEEHPLDSEAREKLAVIYADHYKRLDLAVEQLEEMIAQPNQPARSVVRWLNLLADLQVRSGVGPELVKTTLQRIIDSNPNLAAAELARRRLALLNFEFKAQQANADVKLGAYEQNLGLKAARATAPRKAVPRPSATPRQPRSLDEP